MKRNIQGFSLIELMVAVLIISILAMVSGPAYKSHLIKSKFAQAFTTISSYKDALQAAFLEHDQFPATFAGLTASTYTEISSAAINLIYYGQSTDKQAAYLYFYTNDLGVEGFTASTNTGTGGAKCRVTLAAIATDTGQMRFYCGQWNGSSVDVPLDNLPNSCRDTNISGLIS